MDIFIIKGGNGGQPVAPSDWKPWEERDKCPKCDKPFTKSVCEMHPKCDECCYNMHIRKQHLIVLEEKK